MWHIYKYYKLFNIIMYKLFWHIDLDINSLIVNLSVILYSPPRVHFWTKKLR